MAAAQGKAAAARKAGAANGEEPARMLAKEEQQATGAKLQELVKRHNELPKGKRRLHSYEHCLCSFHTMFAVSGWARVGTPSRPFVFWVLNSREDTELELVRSGYFNDANWCVRRPLVIVFLGHDIKREEIGPAAPKEGDPARIIMAPYSALKDENKPPMPDLVVIFHPDMELHEGGKMSIADSVLPDDVLALMPTDRTMMITLRFRPLAADIEALKGLDRFLKNVDVQANMCSALPLEQPYLDYVDNGWVLVPVNMLKKPLRLLLKFKWSLPGPYSTRNDSDTRKPALFWGILDLKYEYRRPLGERIAILETGDGRSSRFSNDGAPILQLFRERYKLDDSALSGKHAVVSSNKKLTHDLIVRHDYGHVLPPQVCMPMEYREGVADEILEGLGMVGEEDGIVVLKLHNRARGAGVIPVSVKDLPSVLQDLLCHPKDLNAWFTTQLKEMHSASRATPALHWGDYEEEVRHWWSCECPYYVAERYAPSTPQEMLGKFYDGTLRVAFALRRASPKEKESKNTGIINATALVGGASPSAKAAPKKSADKVGDVLMERCPPAEEIAIDWLGGYWKLPKDDMESPDLRRRIVSAARTSGTAKVDISHLLEIYAAMGDIVPKLFGGSEPSLSSLPEWYADKPEFCAYLMARLGISMPEFGSMQIALKRADTQLGKAPEGHLKNISTSFLQRGFGILQAMKPPGSWENAQEFFAKSIKHLPTNATTLYHIGMGELEEGDLNKAVNLFSKSMLLDLDYRAPYVNLGVALLRLRRFKEAIEASEAGYARHNEAPQCLYNIGVAHYHQAYELQESRSPSISEIERLRQKAFDLITQSRDHEEARRLQNRGIRFGPGGIDPPWSSRDDEMLAMTSRGNTSKLKAFPIDEKTGWRWFGWRN